MGEEKAGLGDVMEASVTVTLEAHGCGKIDKGVFDKLLEPLGHLCAEPLPFRIGDVTPSCGAIWTATDMAERTADGGVRKVLTYKLSGALIHTDEEAQ